MDKMQEVLTAIVESINGTVTQDIADAIASLGERAPGAVSPDETTAPPAPADDQPSEPDTPNVAFVPGAFQGSETDPEPPGAMGG